MRPPLLIILMVFVSVIKAQVTDLPDPPNNELKLNLLLLAQGTGEITFERLVNDRVGIGISTDIVLRQGGDNCRKALLAFHRIFCTQPER